MNLNDVFREHAEFLIPTLSAPAAKNPCLWHYASRRLQGDVGVTLGLSKIAIALLVCGLMPVTGCTRTSDGTVVMPVKPLTAPTFNIPRLMPGYGRAKQDGATRFPSPPDSQQASTKARSRPARRIAVTQAVCLEQNKSGERVRVVCK